MNTKFKIIALALLILLLPGCSEKKKVSDLLDNDQERKTNSTSKGTYPGSKNFHPSSLGSSPSSKKSNTRPGRSITPKKRSGSSSKKSSSSSKRSNSTYKPPKSNNKNPFSAIEKFAYGRSLDTRRVVAGQDTVLSWDNVTVSVPADSIPAGYTVDVKSRVFPKESKVVLIKPFTVIILTSDLATLPDDLELEYDITITGLEKNRSEFAYDMVKFVEGADGYFPMFAWADVVDGVLNTTTVYLSTAVYFLVDQEMGYMETNK